MYRILRRPGIIGFSCVSVASVMWMLGLTSCGGGSSTPAATGALNGNWQIFLTQEFPRPTFTNPLSASGFLSQSGSAVTGSVQVPPSPENGKCAGVGAVSGTMSGQNATLVINNGGTQLNLTGALSTDGTTLTGSYSGPGGGCYTTPTSGTWTASLIPPLNGTFAGTITDSIYMAAFTGQTPPPTIGVTGTFTQTGGPGSSNATITGTIQAAGYPCFRTANVSGTISGQNVYLQVFGYNDEQIGTIGVPPSTPATVVLDQETVSLVGSNQGNGLSLGETLGGKPTGPCPPLQTSNGALPTDSAAIDFQLSGGVSTFRQRPAK
jgi:hypothetical protein